ncbi:MAG: YdcF family protein [Limisphaerales bacterium]
MGFLYSLFLKLLYPTSLAVLLLLASALLRKKERVRRLCFWLAIGIIVVCGNGWVIAAMGRHLEWQNLPPNPAPHADCILILSGGLRSRIPPRPTIEVGEAGDRVLYGAYLFRQGKAARILCTGGVATGGIAPRPGAQEMAEFLEMLGVPKSVILTETKSANTRQHARNLQTVFQEQGFKRILLVTSAMHMPRSLGVFRRGCPGIEFIPAPTDFRVTERIPAPWYHELNALVPTPANLLLFSELMHEYLGMAYYRVRGWE